MEHKEMNLFDLCAAGVRGIGRGVQWCWRLLTDSLRLALQKWYIVAPVTLLFLAGGLFFARHSNRIYNVEAQVWLNGPTSDEVANAFTPLAQSLVTRTWSEQSAAELLQVAPEVVATASHFETFNVIDFLNDSTADMVDYKGKYKRTDTLNVVMKQCLQIRFRTKQPQNAAIIGNAILDYLNGNPSLQNSYKEHLEILRAEVGFYDKQVALADSIARTFYMESGRNAVQVQNKSYELMMGRREIKSLYPSLQDLINQAKKSHHELARATAPVVAPQGFIVGAHARNRYSNCGILAILIGYIVGCLIAWAVKRRNDLREWLKKE